MQTKTSKSNDVLFQKLGNNWYAFAEINNEFVYTLLPDGIDPRTTKMELYQIIEDQMVRAAKNNANKRRQAEVA